MLKLAHVPEGPAPRDKLGVALAGGGFRASLFHLGVLRRMAELDLLRYVEVLSTVSGGSIIGALYVLVLKREIESKGLLTREDYLGIVSEVQELLICSIRKNLRTLLFCNPLGILRVMLTSHSLGKRMGRIYERYLYRHVVAQVRQQPGWGRWWRPGRFPLGELRFRPAGANPEGGTETYNAKATQAGGSALTTLIMNATCLNSGKPFRFSALEIGDPQLGFFRHNEIEDQLAPRKALLERFPYATLLARAQEGAPLQVGGQRCSPNTVRVTAWWRAQRERREPYVPPDRLFQEVAFQAFLPRLLGTDFGSLRKAKIPAWYLVLGWNREPRVTGGIPREVHLRRFWDALGQMDEELAQSLATECASNPELESSLLDFVLEVYYLRSAEAMSPRLARDWKALSLGEAVGASACFPPVFPPFLMLGIYDDLQIARLGLTDGGVYDNVGLDSLFAENCTYIIASDTGGLFEVEQRSATGRIGMSARIVNILMDDVAALQRRNLREQRRVTRGIASASGNPRLEELQDSYNLRGLAYFCTNSLPPHGPGLSSEANRNLIASLRTDLDAFGEVEVAALVNQGYVTADSFLRRYLRTADYFESATWDAPSVLPIPPRLTPERTKEILAVGQKRFFRSLCLGAPDSWVVTVFLLAVCVWLTRDLEGSVRGFLRWLADRAATVMDGLPLGYRFNWVDTRFSVPWLIVTLALLVALGIVLPKLVRRGRQRFPSTLRPFVTGFKWLRTCLGNILWLFYLTPIWIAIAVSSVAWVSYVFYSLPFLRRTRNE